MYPSDFLHQTTTHDLLLTVLFSELGIYSVSAPHTMYVGIALIFNDLRTTLTSNLSETVWSQVLGVDVSRADDMALFYDLYTNINFFAAAGAEVETIIHEAVVPSITKMLALETEVRHLVEIMCNEHADIHGDLVRHRMKKTLKQFNVNSYIHLDTQRIQNGS